MSIPADVLWRGAAASFRQPVTEDDELHAQYMMASVDLFNIRSSNGTIIPEPEYRSSDQEIDILRHVFRFDRAPYDFVFQNGFEARREAGTPVEIYCNLEHYVNHGGRPLDIRRRTNHVFVSTTLSSSWYPIVGRGHTESIYRYEIYAPGGILVAQTLGARYQYPAQDEVAFLGGIAPQYIRSAQLFELTNNGNPRRRRVNDILHINRNFNPQSHPQRTLRIQYPVSYYMQNNQQRNLSIQEFTGAGQGLQRTEPSQAAAGQRRLLGIANDVPVPAGYYREGMGNIDGYIDSAFRSTHKNEVYIFIKEKYVLVNYAPGSTNDKILNGPHYIGDSFPSLAGTAFSEYGVDASFGSHRSAEAFIFSGNLCALINFAPRSTQDWIIDGTKTIRQMFPFFTGTSFEKGIDAAFESSVSGEAYLFRGPNYALINYYKKELIGISSIADGFQCFRNSEFERDIGAAFASHAPNQAYLFKGNRYVLFHFTPGKNKDYIINGPKEVVPGNWPSLNGVLPCNNLGLDVIEFPHTKPLPADRDRDEL